MLAFIYFSIYLFLQSANVSCKEQTVSGCL